MAKLPTINKILIEDVNPNADSEEWVRRMLYPLNSFMTSVYGALNGNLEIGTNIVASVKELTFATDSAYTSGTWNVLKFPRGINSKAVEVRVAQLYKKSDPYDPILNAVTTQWLDINGTINITYITGLADSTEYFVRFIVF